MRLTKQGYRLRLGDSLEILKEIPDNFIDSIVCDPPYGLSKEPDMKEVIAHWMAGDDYTHKGGGFMGKKWDSFVPGPAIWKECLRVLKPGGYLLAFFGSRTYDMGALAVRLAGFEIRDQIMWVYGSGFPKSVNLGEGRGSALKPAHEPICMARKPFKATLKSNVDLWGVGGLNIEECRIGDAGRWPANLAHDGSAEALAAFPESSVTGKRSEVSQNAEVEGTAWGNTNHKSVEYTDSGSVARYFYCAKSSKADRDFGLSGFKVSAPEALVNRKEGSAGINNPRAGAGRTSGSANSHPTVKPIKLMSWLVKLVTPVGGLVLDPFAGSGSTGVAALQEQRRFIGIELSEEYLAIAKERLKQVANARKLQYSEDRQPTTKD